jgi:hypothetical protein
MLIVPMSLEVATMRLEWEVEAGDRPSAGPRDYDA